MANDIKHGVWVNIKNPQQQVTVEEEATFTSELKDSEHVVIYKEIERTLGYGSYILGDTFVCNKNDFLTKYELKK